jgi:hypothetical protein
MSELMILFTQVCSDILILAKPSVECVELISLVIPLLIYNRFPGWTNAELRALFDCLVILVSRDNADFFEEWVLFENIGALSEWSEDNLIGVFQYLIRICDVLDQPPPGSALLGQFDPEALIEVSQSHSREVGVVALTFFSILVEARRVEWELIDRLGVNAVLFEAMQGKDFKTRAMAIRYFHAVGSAFGWGVLSREAHLRFIETAQDLISAESVQETRWCLA